MTMETLQADMTDLSARTKGLSSLSTTGDLVDFLKKNLVPFIASHVDESVEIDGCVNDMLENAEDILQTETAEQFSRVIALGTALSDALSTRSPSPEEAAVISEFRKEAATALATIAEITVLEVDDDEDEDETEGKEASDGE